MSASRAQRVKLAKELSKRATGRTLYIQDESTASPHFHDVKKLLEMLHLERRGQFGRQHVIAPATTSG